MPGVRHLHIDDVPARPGAGTGHQWLAMRHALDVRAFGLNAYRADAGVEVIERHDEADGDGGQQELYLVLFGSATFTVGGETIEARAGSFVFIDDPKLERVAIANEPGTTIVAVGAEPGVAFTPSDWEAGWLEKQPPG
jgi:hypothetical protein